MTRLARVPSRGLPAPDGPRIAGRRRQSAIRVPQSAIYVVALALALLPAQAAPKVIATVGVGEWPLGVAVDPETNRVYVANSSADTLSVLDGATGAVLDTVLVGSAPYGVAVNPITGRVFVANMDGQSLSVCDTATNAVIDTIPLPGSPHGLAVDPETNRIYVAARAINGVATVDALLVVDGAGEEVVALVDVGAWPENVTIHQSAKQVWISNWLTDPVALVNGATNTKVGSVNAGASAMALALNPVTNRLYVAASDSDRLHVIDAANLKVIGTIAVGRAPLGVAVNPVTNRVYVANNEANTVSVIDGTLGTVVATVPVGEGPIYLGVNPQTDRVYVANRHDDSVSILSDPIPRLSFTRQPRSLQAGLSGTPAVKVSVLGEDGQPIADGTYRLSLSITPGTGKPGARLLGTTCAYTVNGTATFSDLSVDLATGTAYTLTASAQGAVDAVSAGFLVSAGSGARIAFTTQPRTTVAGAALSPAVRVTVQDHFGNTVSQATDSITMALGANAAGGTLAGTKTVAAVSGVATFSALRLEKAGSGYTLTAAATGLPPATSSAFAITPAPPAGLRFLQQPSDVGAGVGMMPAVQVEVVDAFGNRTTNARTRVAVALGANPSGGTLSGTAARSAIAAVATFTGLKVDKAGSGYALSATAEGLAAATSTAFRVGPGAARRLAFAPPPAGATAGTPFPVAVQVQDAYGNLVTTATSQVTLGFGSNPTRATLSGGGSVNAVAGVATFAAAIARAGSGYTLRAATAGLSSAYSPAFAVAPGPAARLAFVTQPAGATAGAAITPAVRVAVQDACGNTVTTAQTKITMGFGANPVGGTLSGALSALAANGVATLANLKVDKAGTGYTLRATGGGLTEAVSGVFAVAAAAPLRLAFTTAPPASVAVGTRFLCRATAQDAFGNTAKGATGSITLTVRPAAGGNPLQTLSGSFSGGSALFSVVIRSPGGYRLTATATGLSSASADTTVTP